MDALAILEVETRTVDAIGSAQAKRQQKSGAFDKVLKQKEQPRQLETPRISTAKQAEAGNCSRDERVDCEKAVLAVEQVQKEVSNSGEIAVAKESEVQSLVDWLMTIISPVGGETETEESTVATEDALAEVEMILTQLVEQVPLEDLQGLNLEIADGDLFGPLVDTTAMDNSELAESIEALAAMLMAVPQQQSAPVEVKVMAAARELLQQVIVAANAVSTVAEKGAVTEVEDSLLTAKNGLSEVAVVVEKIDPRFAGLLQPRTDQVQVQPDTSRQHSAPLHGNEQQEPLELMAETVAPQVKLEAEQSASVNDKQGLDSLLAAVAKGTHTQGLPPVHVAATSRVAPQTQMVQLPSGQQVSDGQICDQVVTQLTGSINGESGRMVLRLQPAELGSLKLEITIEGDRIRANLHAQTQQVQEVLERNLPQLRNALAEQGLKIDQFQVTSNNSEQQGQFDNLSQQQHDSSRQQNELQQNVVEGEELSIPLAHLMQNGGGGISLHV